MYRSLLQQIQVQCNCDITIYEDESRKDPFMRVLIILFVKVMQGELVTHLVVGLNFLILLL